MGEKNRRIALGIILCVLIIGFRLINAFDSYAMQSLMEEKTESMSSAENEHTFEYVNEHTGYCAKIEDAAELLNAEQESCLLETMQGITAYGNVIFHSTDSNYTSAADYARQYYYNQFRDNSGTIFLIDMNNRMIYIFSDGAVYRVITKGRANTITDNIYQYASNGDYYICAVAAFSQELTLLEGGRISQPMKYASNALLALVLALLINYYIARKSAETQKPSVDEVLTGLTAGQHILDFQVKQTYSNRVYRPGGSGGTGSGGGGSSGGGGGHSF